MTMAVFHDFPVLENGLTKFHDFPGRVVTLYDDCLDDKIKDYQNILCCTVYSNSAYKYMHTFMSSSYS